jgi:hypothetical protein
MTTSIQIHNAADARVDSFMPDNAFALRIKTGKIEVTYFDLDPVLAWALFDLMRDGGTSFHYQDQSINWLRDDPQAAADLIRRAREETLPVVTEAEAV